MRAQEQTTEVKIYDWIRENSQGVGCYRKKKG
jgi:hypothetical protein